MHWLKSAIAFGFIFFSGLLFSQTLAFSREFGAVKSHVPIQILNNHSNYFYVLRYNKRVHDFTVERRSKKTFEIISFTALKLDSINAAWFDYENLDYLFFENNHRVYFVFEKVLNEKRFIYLKQIDTLGKSSGFKELATLEKDAAGIDFRFLFKQCNDSELLIVGEQYYQNSTSKKVALVYDLDKHENKHIVKLPLENMATGFSQAFECFGNKLYYVLSNSYFHKHRKFYTVNQEILKPVYKTKILNVGCFNLENKSVKKTSFYDANYYEIKNIKIQPSHDQINVLLQACNDNASGESKLFFLVEAFDVDLEKQKHFRVTPLDTNIIEQLTFYDGAEKKEASEKDYKLCFSSVQNNQAYQFCERKDENYFKEILFWKSNLENGHVEVQKIIPRKIFFFDDRTRFKNLQQPIIIQTNNNTHVFLLEHKSNFKQNANAFNFHKFKKQKYVWAANIVEYSINNSGDMSKRITFKNSNFNVVPLKYTSTQNEAIFYLNKGATEKFAILSL